MEKLTDNQLETTTKRTIMENEQMASELAYQSRQTENLLTKNKKLLEDNLSLKRSESPLTENLLTKNEKLLEDNLSLKRSERRSDPSFALGVRALRVSTNAPSLVFVTNITLVFAGVRQAKRFRHA
eukprot:1392392-Pyramimonas_sp.AAC.1